jgi:NADPH:quinone reductase-like Zn-dependent oxidoreductase
MKAFVRLIGDEDEVNIGVIERPIPIPGHGQLRVRVEAVALNHTDMFLVDDNLENSPAFPNIAGNDIAGVVVELGEGVNQFAEGDRMYVSECISYRDVLIVIIFVYRFFLSGKADDKGGFQQFTLVDQDVVAKVRILRTLSSLLFHCSYCIRIVRFQTASPSTKLPPSSTHSLAL